MASLFRFPGHESKGNQSILTGLRGLWPQRSLKWRAAGRGPLCRNRHAREAAGPNKDEAPNRRASFPGHTRPGPLLSFSGGTRGDGAVTSLLLLTRSPERAGLLI